MTSYYDIYLNDKDGDACDTQFRYEILEFFDLTSYDETKLAIKSDKLYYELLKNNVFVKIFETALHEPNFKMFCPETEISAFCLTILLSFEYFHLFKICYNDYKKGENAASGQILIDKLLSP